MSLQSLIKCVEFSGIRLNTMYFRPLQKWKKKCKKIKKPPQIFNFFYRKIRVFRSGVGFSPKKKKGKMDSPLGRQTPPAQIVWVRIRGNFPDWVRFILKWTRWKIRALIQLKNLKKKGSLEQTLSRERRRFTVCSKSKEDDHPGKCLLQLRVSIYIYDETWKQAIYKLQFVFITSIW